LRHAWTFNTGDAPQGKVENKLIAFEDQPRLIERNLIVSTRLRHVIALDPRTWGCTFIGRWLCQREASPYKYGPTFRPPSFQGTILSPSVGGGPN
jgi:glucose dehydrogenase